MNYETVRIFQVVMIVGILLAVIGNIDAIGYTHLGVGFYLMGIGYVMIIASAVVFGKYLHERRRFFLDYIEMLRIRQCMSGIPDDDYMMDITQPPIDRSFSLGPAIKEVKPEPLPEITDLRKE